MRAPCPSSQRTEVVPRAHALYWWLPTTAAAERRQGKGGAEGWAELVRCLMRRHDVAGPCERRKRRRRGV